MDIGLTLSWWHWSVLALVLLGLELFAPGAFFIWIGVGAGLTSGIIWLSGLENWVGQAFIFVVLSFVSLAGGRRIIGKKMGTAPTGTLNRRLAQYVGETGTLDQAIVNGFGRVKMGDTVWRVRGHDAPAGATVRVIGVDGSDLVVELV